MFEGLDLKALILGASTVNGSSISIFFFILRVLLKGKSNPMFSETVGKGS